MLVFAFGLLLAVPARAEVRSQLAAFQVLPGDNGAERYAAADAAKPGDVIEYRLEYRNDGKQAVTQLVVNGPVPAGTVYIGGSAQTATRAQLKFSYDGGTSWHVTAPLQVIKGTDGKSITRPAPDDAVTNVEWLVQEPLKAGIAQQYRYRVRVVTGSEPTNTH